MSRGPTRRALQRETAHPQSQNRELSVARRELAVFRRQTGACSSRHLPTAAGGVDLAQAELDYLDGYDLAEVLDDPSRKRDYILGEMNLVCGHPVLSSKPNLVFRP